MQRPTFSLKTAGDLESSAGRWWLLVAVICAAGLAASPAMAQEKSTDDEQTVDGPLADQFDDYWSVDRDVDVIKDKIYRRKGRFAVGLQAGMMSSEPFFFYNPVGLRLDYYFSNAWGVELEGTYMGTKGVFRHDTDLTGFVRSQRPGFEERKDALDIFKWRAHALATWSPFYGKLALLQRKLAHFDLNLAAGFGAVSLVRPSNTRGESTNKITPEFVFGGGVHFFASENITLRLSGRGYVYSGPMNYKNTETGRLHVQANPNHPNVKKANFFQKLEMPSEFLLGVSYMF